MKTLLVLPNAIGDIITGLGIAHRLREDGEVTWIVSGSAGGMESVLEREGFQCIVPPAARVRRMAAYGMPVEVLRRETVRFLDELRERGPFDRVVNPHFSLAASRMAGAVDAAIHHGPAAGEIIVSDCWSDFIASSILKGVLPEISMPERCALICGWSEAPRPRFHSVKREMKAGGIIVFQPGSGWPSKSLSVDRAAEIARALSSDYEVAMIGGPADAEYLREAKRIAGTRLLDFVPGPIDGALELISQAALVVTADSWSLHAANALDVPTLAILGPTRIFASPRTYALAAASEPTWLRDGNDSISAVSAEDVVGAARVILGGENRKTGDGPDRVVFWRSESGFMEPDRPLELSGILSEKFIFSWARGRAFADLGVATNPALPIPRFRPRASLERMYRRFDDIRAAILGRLQDFAEMFELYATTFPGHDADDLARRWCRGTTDYLRD